jgi:hypothetical protein
VFLIPPQDQKTIQQQLNESLKGTGVGVSLKVEPIAEGQQQIELYYHGDPSDALRIRVARRRERYLSAQESRHTILC